VSENDYVRPSHMFRWVIVAVVVLAAIWLAASLFFFAMRPMMSPYYTFYHPFFFPFGLIFGIFVIFIVFGALRWVFWGLGGGYRRRYWKYRDRPYHILRARYARGEITKEQFEQMMRDLKENAQPT